MWPFRKKEKVMKMITETGNGFYSWNGNLYKSDIVRSCIRPKAKAIGKAVAKHIRETAKENETKLEVNPVVHIKMLLEEPNAYMTGQMLQEKVANQLILNGNAFILILRDEHGKAMGLYPIPAVTAECEYDENGKLRLKFYYPNGQYSKFDYEDIIHLRHDFCMNDIFGESPQAALAELMNVVTTIDQGIVHAIKNSTIVRWLLKFNSAMRPEELPVRAKEFAESYLNVSTSKAVGVAAVDSKSDAQQISTNDYVPNAAQMDKQTKRIYAFFNTNEKIVTSSFGENEWISYYEAEIEPDIMQMSGEYSRKLFTRKERSFGNKIVFESSDLTFASMQTKLGLTAWLDRGALSINELRKYLNKAPVPGGDVYLLRKDTAVRTGEGGE